jgi:glycosyltransferase involved in cell wall biosynthesis
MRNALDLPGALTLARIVRDLEIDLIHAHMARDYPLAAIASKRAGDAPLVLTRHVLFPINRIHRKALARAARFIAVSEAVARSLKSQKILEAQKIVTIHNGIDIERFALSSGSKDRTRPTNAPLLVGMVGHIAPIKGQEDFIRAASIIAQRRTDVSFIIIGADKSRQGENRAAMEALAAKLKVDKRVHFAGWQKDVRSLLSKLDVFVSASRSEPFGLVILEAMATGVPVVATASEGALEIIENGVTGRIVPIADPESLAAAVTDLLDDPAARARLAENALQTVKQKFSLDEMINTTESLYADVVAERP